MIPLLACARNYLCYDSAMSTRETSREDRIATWVAFLRAHSRITAMLEQELMAAEGLSVSWFDVLEQLRQSEGHCLRMQDLGQRLAMSASGLSRRVGRMEQAGLVERRRAPEDGRGVQVALTSLGNRRYRRALPVHLRGVEHHFLDHIKDDEAVDLLRFLEGLLADTSEFPDSQLAD